MSDTVLRAEKLGKHYVLPAGHTRYKTLRDTLAHPFTFAKKIPPQSLWALKDISLEVRRGDMVGIVGDNGSGKSTLLKILSRITQPSEGFAEIRGRTGSLLEVGTGFHPELTGRENIFLNAAILGMKRREIQNQFDQIVAFAEVEKFLDTPVKHYSSGMTVRLAFAVAAHLNPEILLVDEVLAVGDFKFQEKCLGRMENLGKEGKTILLVTHNMALVSKLCNKAILLEKGRLCAEGPPCAVVQRYLKRSGEATSRWIRKEPLPTGRGIVLTQVKAYATESNPEESMGEFPSDKPHCVEVTYRAFGPDVLSRIVLHVETQDGTILLATTDCDARSGMDMLRPPGQHTCRCVFPPHLLAPGTYAITAAATRTQSTVWDRVSRAVQFRISRIGSLSLIDQRPGAFAPILPWESLQTAASEGELENETVPNRP